MGKIIVELDNRRAPQTVKNFLTYVKKKSYDGTIFHRVIKGFMIQGGGFGIDNIKKPTRRPVRNESNNGLENLTGTIAMARTTHVDSATRQFYINLNNNTESLDATFTELGYTVFGKVVIGLDIVFNIADVKTAPVRSLGKNAPIDQVVIYSISLIETTNKTEQKVK